MRTLLSLVTKENEVEDIKQKINAKPDQAQFIDTDQSGEKLYGPTRTPKGQSKYALSPSNNPSSIIHVIDGSDGLIFKFQDNAAFVTVESYALVKSAISNRLEEYKSKGITIESKVTDFALSGAEGQRIAVERLLIFRSLLIELGVSPSLIKLKTVKADERRAEEGAEKRQEEDYGWISVKKN